MSLRIDDVERPDGSRTEHEVVRGPDAAGVVVCNRERGMLMIYRHRFLPDTWGWEIPGGALEPSELPIDAARRECLEETGWEPEGELRHLTTHHPSVGLVNQTFHIYLASDATRIGPPTDANEAVRVDWRSCEQVAADIRGGQISDSFSQLGAALAFAAIGVANLLEPT
ncbi:MAG: NUDIX hydrolase [Actinomycetota bacterium]